MKLFQLTFAPDHGHWMAKDPIAFDGSELDTWFFIRGRPYKGPEIRVPTLRSGPQAHISYGSSGIVYFDQAVVDVVTPTLANDVEFVPVRTDTGEELFAVNTLHNLDAIDDAATVSTKRVPCGGPSKDSEAYLIITQLVIDMSRVGTRRAFRLAKWIGPLIVSSEVASALSTDDLMAGSQLIPISTTHE